MRKCPHDNTPLVITFEQPGAELYCLRCARYFGMFDVLDVDANDEEHRILDHLDDLFREGWRHGLAEHHFQAPPVADASDDNIKCGGCGRNSGRTVEQGKPAAWYSRVRDGIEQFACSRDCIDEIAKATGTDRVILPW